MNDSILKSTLWTQTDDSSSRDEEANADESIRRESTEGDATLRNAVKYGSLGGFVATLSMTTFRMPTSKSLPPTAQFWATYVGSGEPEDYPGAALVLHLIYGVVGGVFFAVLTPGSDDTEEVAESKGALLGTVYGIALSVFGMRVVLERVLDTDPARDERLVFHISHVVYGLTLGTWVGSRFGNER